MEHDSINILRGKINEIVTLSPSSEDFIHSINTFEWVCKLYPAAEDDHALEIAALGHDIERGFNDRRIESRGYGSYDEFKQAHALNSAEILVELMEECGVEQALTHDVAHLVAHHETGGNEREELLKDANVLSFFHVCLPLYYDRRGTDITKKRCVWGYNKLSYKLREHVREMEFLDTDLHELINESIGSGD